MNPVVSPRAQPGVTLGHTYLLRHHLGTELRVRFEEHIKGLHWLGTHDELGDGDSPVVTKDMEMAESAGHDSNNINRT